jgi:hypothetical protein
MRYVLTVYFYFISVENFAALVHKIVTELNNFGYQSVEDFFASNSVRPCHLLSTLLAVDLAVVRDIASNRLMCYVVMEILGKI